MSSEAWTTSDGEVVGARPALLGEARRHPLLALREVLAALPGVEARPGEAHVREVHPREHALDVARVERVLPGAVGLDRRATGVR